MAYREDEEEKALKAEYGHQRYPEDVKMKMDVRAFPDEFKQFSPTLYEESEDDFETEYLDENFVDEVPVSQREYAENPFDYPISDYTSEDKDYKFQGQLW